MKLVKVVPSLVVMGILLTACGGSGSAGVTLGKKIAFLLPDSQATRYAGQDLPLFTAKLKSVCSDCTVDYRNANQDAATQLTQAQAALAGGANVLVLDPVDGAAAATIAAKAKARQVPVIAYDRLVLNAPSLSYFVSFDNSAVPELQTNGLLTALKGKTNPTVVMLNGDSGDAIATALKLGGKINIAKASDTPSSNPDSAQTKMAGALASLHNNVDAVYAVDDATAGGASAALTAAGVKPFPPITGDGAELSAVQRILAGKQYMTVYRSIRAEAETAALLAYDLAYGVGVPTSMTNGKTVDNGSVAVPALLISPVAVTRQTIISTVIADRFWSRADVCADQYASACISAGIA